MRYNTGGDCHFHVKNVTYTTNGAAVPAAEEGYDRS